MSTQAVTDFDDQLYGEIVELYLTITHPNMGLFKVQGYFIDHDADFYYLGNIPGEANKKVVKAVVAIVDVVEAMSLDQALLEEFEPDGEAN